MIDRARPIRVKVCGITRAADAVTAVELGAAAIGVNFHSDSPRYVAPARAAEIAEAVRGRALLVGVFVNRPAFEVGEILDRVGLDRAQLHGDEGPDAVNVLGGRALKAFRLRPDAPPPDLAPWAAAWGFLFEARRPGLYGGSGRAWAYDRIAGLDTAKPVLIAGGIRPGTARRAAELSGAGWVDVCSGVESAPGIKDRRLLEALFREVAAP